MLGTTASGWLDVVIRSLPLSTFHPWLPERTNEGHCGNEYVCRSDVPADDRQRLSVGGEADESGSFFASFAGFLKRWTDTSDTCNSLRAGIRAGQSRTDCGSRSSLTHPPRLPAKMRSFLHRQR